MLVDRMAELAKLLLPDGEKRGTEWVALNPGRADRRKGSLSVNLNTGVWKDFASGQGARNLPGLGLVANFAAGGDFLAGIAWAKKWLGIEEGGASVAKAKDVEEAARAARAKREAEEQRRGVFKRELAFKLFLGARPLDGTDPASLYLRGRGIEMRSWPRALRFHHGIEHPGHPGRWPALLACMSLEGAPNGFGGVHRIYLERGLAPLAGCAGTPPRDAVGENWVKAFGGVEAKLALGYLPGATIRIQNGASGKRLGDAPEGEELLLTEGVEDACALAIALPDARICAAYSLAAIGQAKFPENIRRVTIVADNDEGQAVEQLERASEHLAHRHELVSVAHLPAAYKDVNDALIGKVRG